MLNRVTIVVWLVLLGLVAALSFSQVDREGDWAEYLAYAHAFSTHLTPDIRPQDSAYVANLMPSPQSAAGQAHDTLEAGGIPHSGFHGDHLETASGKVYTWHFWLYSAFVAPLLTIVRWLGLPPLNAFVLCNWLFLLGALGYLAFYWKAPPLEKHILAALVLLTGTTYYVWWPHPETFTASLVLLALMLASDRRYGWALLAAALPATQDPPVAVLVFLIAALTLADTYTISVEPFSIKPKSGSYRRLLCIVVALCVAFSPVIFYEITLGVPNPIVEAGQARLSLISWPRLYSLYFDLDQGLVVAAPGVFIGAAAIALLALAKGLRRQRRAEAVSLISPLVVGSAISILMAIPALSGTNWNHGQSVFIRYAYWIGMPVLFGLAGSLARLSRWLRVSAVSAVVALQLLTVAFYGVWGKNWRANDLSFKPMARFVMEHDPRLYDPVPAIFIVRSTHHLVSHISNYENRVYLFPNRGEPTKELLQISKLRTLPPQCMNGHVTREEDGWVYLDFSDTVPRSCVSSK